MSEFPHPMKLLMHSQPTRSSATSPGGRSPVPVTMPKQHVKWRYHGMAVVSSLLAAMIGLLGLTTWAVPWLAFSFHSPQLSIYLYPEAGLAFFLLGLALLAYTRNPSDVRVQAGVCLIGVCTTILALLDLRA